MFELDWFWSALSTTNDPSRLNQTTVVQSHVESINTKNYCGFLDGWNLSEKIHFYKLLHLFEAINDSVLWMFFDYQVYK